MAAETRAIAATMEVGGYYDFNFAGMPRAHGTFEGWTDFGFMVFTSNEGETLFYNPALLCTIRPERFDSIIAGVFGDQQEEVV